MKKRELTPEEKLIRAIFRDDAADEEYRIKQRKLKKRARMNRES
jgi:hypothetical protein